MSYKYDVNQWYLKLGSMGVGGLEKLTIIQGNLSLDLISIGWQVCLFIHHPLS